MSLNDEMPWSFSKFRAQWSEVNILFDNEHEVFFKVQGSVVQGSYLRTLA